MIHFLETHRDEYRIFGGRVIQRHFLKRDDRQLLIRGIGEIRGGRRECNHLVRRIMGAIEMRQLSHWPVPKITTFAMNEPLRLEANVSDIQR